MRMFSEDREPQHNGGEDDKDSLSGECHFCFFFFFFFKSGGVEKREGPPSHK